MTITISAGSVGYPAGRPELKHELSLRILDTLLAIRMPVLSLEQIPNEYCGPTCCPHNVWYLVEVPAGKLKIGWRKRVININWSATTIERTGYDVSSDEVTRGDRMIHAYGYAKLAEYLRALLTEPRASVPPSFDANGAEVSP